MVRGPPLTLGLLEYLDLGVQIDKVTEPKPYHIMPYTSLDALEGMFLIIDKREKVLTKLYNIYSLSIDNIVQL